MFKRLIAGVILVLAGLAAVAWYTFFSPATFFAEKSKILYLYSDQTSRDQVLEMLVKDSFLERRTTFDWLARRNDYWSQVKPGRYKINKGTSVFELEKLLKEGRQEPNNLVINKLRTIQDLARVMARYIETDSASIAAFFMTPDSLTQFGLDTASLFTRIIPNSYQVLWTWKPAKVLDRLTAESDKWWSRNGRMDSAKARGLSTVEAYTLASIVEEETNKITDKPLIASVYLNRLKNGMPLQADPTVRYARRDFVTNRVTYDHLKFPSAYNTYLNKGLPPGPICTPQPATLDAVLQAPETDYLFFVAKPDFSGFSVFTTNLKDHSRAARAYQDSLNAWLKRKAAKEKEATGDAPNAQAK